MTKILELLVAIVLPFVIFYRISHTISIGALLQTQLFSERAKLTLRWCQLRFWMYIVHICQYMYVKILARTFSIVLIRTHANNCSIGTAVYG